MYVSITMRRDACMTLAEAAASRSADAYFVWKTQCFVCIFYAAIYIQAQNIVFTAACSAKPSGCVKNNSDQQLPMKHWTSYGCSVEGGVCVCAVGLCRHPDTQGSQCGDCKAAATRARSVGVRGGVSETCARVQGLSERPGGCGGGSGGGVVWL